jgi:hypothetical protein
MSDEDKDKTLTLDVKYTLLTDIEEAAFIALQQLDYDLKYVYEFNKIMRLIRGYLQIIESVRRIRDGL